MSATRGKTKVRSRVRSGGPSEKSELGRKKPITFQSRVGLLSYLPGMHYLEIPARVVKHFDQGFKLRVICTVNGKVKFQGGFMALGQGKAYISITRKRLQELGLREGSSAKVTLSVDSSEFGAPMPEELKEVLAQDDEGRERFKKLTPGKQRYIIQYVGSVKSPDLRLDRALLLIGNLKALPLGKERFREMLGKG